jgi:YD repeat-containing protein
VIKVGQIRLTESPVASGISTNHVSLPTGTLRGNQTSVCRWLNTTGGTLCTHTTYYDTGMPYQVTDSRGNITTYSYSPTYAGAYVTQATMPATGSVQHVVSATYDFDTGKLATFTDQNNQVFHYYYDPLWRMSSATFPDNGQTVFNYPDLVTIETKKQIDSSRWTDSHVLFDGLGRVSQNQLNSDPDGITYAQTNYDALGRIGQVYNPTRCYPPTTNCGESTWG